MGICKTVERDDNNAKYFFNELEDVISGGPTDVKNDIKTSSMEQRVSLSITLKNIDLNTPHKVELIIYSDNNRRAYKSCGFTENKTKNLENIIIFEKFFIIPYFFEKQQLLDFKVFYGNNNQSVLQTSLGSIMGSRKQTLKKKLETGTDIEITGKEIKKSNKIMNFEINCKGSLIGMNIKYRITNNGTVNNSYSKKLYESETKVCYNMNNIKFDLCKIPVMYLNTNGKAEENIVSIEIIDVKRKITIGEYKGTISRLMVPDALEIALNNRNTAHIKCVVETNYSFISYLHSGMIINLTIGIDFTGSNGHYLDGISYHYIKSDMNNYEKAIKSCGDIVAYYDYDQMFPVFGFGFVFNDEEENTKLFGKYTNFNYPINCNTDNPEIYLIDGVLKEYRNFLPKINLSGPTNFAPIINDLNYEVKKNLSEGKKWNYNILMILTDGQIDDMPDTKDALVEASFLPISVIIIGIGDGDFGNMDNLDADENPLYDRRGRKADRDLVQFVPFNDFKNNPDKLAEQVLEEIPRQVVEYYQHNKIDPKEGDELDDNIGGNNMVGAPSPVSYNNNFNNFNNLYNINMI